MKIKQEMNYLKNILYLLIIVGGIQCSTNEKFNKPKTVTTSEALENGFEQILQYHIDKGKLHKRTENNLRSFLKYLIDQTEYTKKRLAEVVAEINYETIKPDEEYNVWPDLEFWRGVDDFGTAVALNYDGGVDVLDEKELVVVGRYDNYETPPDSVRLQASKEKNSIKIDLQKYPISILGYYEYKFDETILYYTWMGYLWQEIEGYKCGIKAKTVQNSSIVMYSLNDYLDGDFSDFLEADYGDKPPKLNSFFPRKLSLIELFLRASQTGYPFNPYENYWRYFEKGDEFREIVAYEFSTGIRTGKKINRHTAPVNQIIKHKNSITTLKHLTTFTNKMIFEGWEEQLRPLDMPERMHENAFDYNIRTGIHWSKDQNNDIPEQVIKSFEEKFNVKLPSSFFHYLRILNGRPYNMSFPINDLYTVQVKKFHTIDELSKLFDTTIQKDSQNLWIGELHNGKMLGINIEQESEHYGRVTIADNEQVETCDYSFEKFAKYAQVSPVQPEIFAAQENNADFLQKRLNEGWDYTISYGYQTAISEAAKYNSHEALAVLLEAGARLVNNKHRDMPYKYDEQTMDLLDKYQKN